MCVSVCRCACRCVRVLPCHVYTPVARWSTANTRISGWRQRFPKQTLPRRAPMKTTYTLYQRPYTPVCTLLHTHTCRCVHVVSPRHLRDHILVTVKEGYTFFWGMCVYVYLLVDLWQVARWLTGSTLHIAHQTSLQQDGFTVAR